MLPLHHLHLTSLQRCVFETLNSSPFSTSARVSCRTRFENKLQVDRLKILTAVLTHFCFRALSSSHWLRLTSGYQTNTKTAAGPAKWNVWVTNWSHIMLLPLVPSLCWMIWLIWMKLKTPNICFIWYLTCFGRGSSGHRYIFVAIACYACKVS